MKKFLLVILALSICFSVCACGNKNEDELLRQKIIGTWQSDYDDTVYFFSNGTYITSEINASGSGYWDCTDGYLTMTGLYGGTGEGGVYKLTSDNTLEEIKRINHIGNMTKIGNLGEE